MSDRVIDTLRPLVTQRRAERIERVIEGRLKGITVLLEGLYDHGNITAVFRTCEALGVHCVHVADLAEEYKPARRVGQGAQKWLEIRSHPSVDEAVEHLRERGYRLAATDLQAGQTLEELDVSTPLALVFGNERQGVSRELLAHCDETFVIPMRGYSQSLNISSAAAICLFDVTRRYRRLLGRGGDLDEAERAEVRELFYRRAVKRSDLLVD